MRTSLALAALLVARLALADAPPVFDGDPVDPGSGMPWSILPGAPLVYPGPDGEWDTGDDVIDTGIVGDVDVVVRTGSPYLSGPIPLPAGSVAAAAEIVAGGTHGGSGTHVPFSVVLSDGVTPPPAGAPLTGSDLDARRVMAAAFADYDGDGVVGPTPGTTAADLEIRRQEALGLAGRFEAEIVNGVATGELAVSVGLPASAGGLGLVVAAGAMTGATPTIYVDGPWIATAMPFMLPVDPTQIVGGGEPGDPLDAIGIVDLELSQEGLFLPVGHPGLGTPYALPLDGSSPTVDLLRGVSGAAVGAVLAREIDRGAFTAQWGRILRPAVGPGGTRLLVEPVEQATIAADGVGSGRRSVLLYAADLLGNAADPPPGGFAVGLEVGDALRIAAPDTDGDPTRETVVFTDAAAVTVTLDDAGPARPADVSDRLLATRDGVPVAAVAVTVTAGPGGGGGGTPRALAVPDARLVHARRGTGRDRLVLRTELLPDAAPAGVLRLTVRAGDATVLTDEIAVADLRWNGKHTRATRRGGGSRVALRRLKKAAGRWALDVQAGGLDLSAVAIGLPALDVALDVDDVAFAASPACRAAGRTTRCATP